MLKDVIQSFLPWILFSILKGHTQTQLDVAVIVSAITAVAFELKALKKGFVLSWGTLIYFIFLLIAIVVYKSVWVLNHEWLLSSGTLALIAWVSVLIRQPFTIQYAKEIVEEESWKHPLFLKINDILSIVWACTFVLHVILHYTPAIIDQIVSYGSTILAVYFTQWFPDWYKKRQINLLR